MRLLWTLRWILVTFLLPGSGGQSGDHDGFQLDPGDLLFALPLNDSAVADGVAEFILQDQEEVSDTCSITLLTRSETREHEATHPSTQEDLGPVKGLMEGTSSILESLVVAMKEEIGKGSYQSVISKTLLDIKLQNEESNNIMADIGASLEAQSSADSHLTKFKEKVGKMEAMLQSIHCLASQVEQVSEVLAMELSQDLGKSRQLESGLGQKMY